MDMDLIPSKCLEEDARLSQQGKNMIQQKEQIFLAPKRVNGLDEATRSLVSKVTLLT